MILFEYKGVKITGFVRDEVALLRGRLKTEIDHKIYNEKAKEILFSYIPESDYELNERIQKELQEMEDKLMSNT